MAEQAPEKKFRRGLCSVSIFANEFRKDKQVFQIRKAVFQKRYKDSDGEWHSTSSLDTSDIPKAILCLNEAYEYLTRPDNGEESSSDG